MGKLDCVKNVLRRLVNHSNSISSERYVAYLREKGIKIGEGSYFFDPEHTKIDTQRPHLLRIGDYVKITSGVIILCHDYSRSVCIDSFGVNIGEAGETVIGSNVFIGMNAVILMGSKVGDNSIIGAGAVVSGNIPPNSVVAGNPAKVICSLEDYRNKRCKRERVAALTFASHYHEHYGQWPTVEQMTDAFAWLYLPHDMESVHKYPSLFKLSGVNKKKALEAFVSSEPMYSSYEAFLDEAKQFSLS